MGVDAPPKDAKMMAQTAEMHKLAETLTPDRARDLLVAGRLQPMQIGALMSSGKLKEETMQFFITVAQKDLERLESEYESKAADMTKRERKEAGDAILRKKANISRLEFFKDLQKIPKLKPAKLILLVGWSLAMSSLDMTIVNICNPLIMHEKNFVGEHGTEIPMSTIQWINDIYSVAFASFAIPASKIGDRYGVTVVHRWGVSGFVLFSTLCGLSRHITANVTPWPYGGFYVLIGARLFQGITAAFLMANSMSLCGILVEQKDIPTAMAMNSMAFAAATALGPPLGGMLGQFVGWDFCFFINIFIGFFSILFCWLYLPKVPRFKESKFDYVGTVLILLSLIVMIMGLTFIPPEKGAVAMGVVLFLLGIGGIVGFVFWELKHPFAILPRAILTNKKIIYSLLAGLWNFALIVTVSFQMPFALQNIHQLEPYVVGLLSLVSPIAQTASSIVCNFLAKKMTSYIIKLVVSIYVAVLIIILGFIVPYDIGWIVICNMMFSFGLGVFFTTNNQYMMAIATPDIRGMMGGCIQTFREAGYAIGIALVNVIHDLYMNLNWGSAKVPYPQIDSNPLWVKYTKVYYDAFAVTDIIMSLVSILAMCFALLSGTSIFEADKFGYPKKLKLKIEAEMNASATSVKIDDNAGSPAAPEAAQEAKDNAEGEPLVVE